MKNSQPKKAVVTLCTGEKYEKIGELTHPGFRKYAERIGAEFVVINAPKLSNLGFHAHFEKFQIYDLLESFDRIAFIDTDILITSTCPDLFKVIKTNQFGVFMASEYTTRHDEAVKIIQKELGEIDWERDCFNSGVMVFSRCHREAFDYQKISLKKWADWVNREGNRAWVDQTYLNYVTRLLKFEIFDMGYKFNHTTAPRNSWNRFNSYIIHYPGKGHRRGEKMDQIKKDSSIINNPLLFEFSRKLPHLNIVFDRLI